MNANWRDDLYKFVIGGCGTQIGLFLTCGLFASILVICLVCGFTGLLSALVGRFSQNTAAVAATDSAPALGVSQTTLESPSAPPPASESATVLVVDNREVTTLPATGNLLVLPDRPTPIVTATQGRVNLRLGPGTEYPSVGLLPNKASLPIVGRTSDSSWWLVSTTVGLVWVYDGVITTSDLYPEIPIVDFGVPPDSTHSQTLTVPAASDAGVGEGAAGASAVPVEPVVPAGTPTPDANAQRILAEQTVGYKRLREQLVAPPVSASFAPNGDPIAITEGVKLHLVAGDGSYSQMLLDSNEIFRISGGVVWSPDGEYLAFVVDYKARSCRPCRSVGLVRLADQSIFFLKTPDNLDSDAPRWTQDGRLVVNVHPTEPASGTTYIYDVTGRGQKATGLLQLSASHEGQKWFPWQPGRSWRAGVSERPDTYYD